MYASNYIIVTLCENIIIRKYSFRVGKDSSRLCINAQLQHRSRAGIKGLIY